MKHLTGSIVALAAILTASAPAGAASFNCRYAASPAEVAICNSGQLHQLDEEMASIYFGLKADLPRDGVWDLKQGQRRFIARRDACGYSKGCISAAYQNRIDRMCSLADDYGLDCQDY
ncbi:MAG: hypothetical protein U1E15_06020 [Hyphomicrobiales bacterium]